jgi:WD40 repeat protein
LTASRDGKCGVWRVAQVGSGVDKDDGMQYSLQQLYMFTPFGGVAVTALDCAFNLASSGDSQAWLIALGGEDGSLSCWQVTAAVQHDKAADSASVPSTTSCLRQVPSSYAHGMQVRRVRFNRHSVPPTIAAEAGLVKSKDKLLLASISEDHTVRIFSC